LRKANYQSFFGGYKFLLYEIILWLFIIIIALLYIFDVLRFNPSDVFVFIVPLFFILIPFLLISSVKSDWNSAKHLPKYCKWVFNDFGVTISREYTASSIPWHYIIKITEFKSGYILSITTQVTFLLPKRALKETEIVVLNKLLRNRLGANIAKLRT
ncbi:MAG: YcxB family protein, partial [Candidatus Heimdallarchaeota archaeon]